jgi:acyl carrier protein
MKLGLQMEKLTKLIASVLQINSQNVGPDLTMKSTESWDSLRHMELITAIEQDFEIDLTSDDIVQMGSYTGIVNVLKQKGVSV